MVRFFCLSRSDQPRQEEGTQDDDGQDAVLEGGTIDGLSTALGLEITVKDGQVQQSNFDDYPLARIAAPDSMPVASSKA